MDVQIGVHCKKDKFKTLYQAIENKFKNLEDEKGKEINIIQIFTRTRMGKAMKLDILKIREIISKHNAELFIHSAYNV